MALKDGTQRCIHDRTFCTVSQRSELDNLDGESDGDRMTIESTRSCQPGSHATPRTHFCCRSSKAARRLRFHGASSHSTSRVLESKLHSDEQCNVRIVHYRDFICFGSMSSACSTSCTVKYPGSVHLVIHPPIDCLYALCPRKPASWTRQTFTVLNAGSTVKGFPQIE